MSLSDSFENKLALLLFNNTAIANLGDAGGVLGSVVPGSLYVSLHTANPGEAGAQNTNEAGYAGYARIAIARSGAGWVVTGNSVSPAANITFGAPTSGPENETYWGIGTASSGAGILLGSGALSSTIAVTNGGAAPVINTSSVITFD